MMDRPTVAELKDRFAQCARYYGGAISHDAGLVWDGYIAALLEWGLISPADHDELVDLLPKVANNPVMGVFLGWNQDAETCVAPDCGGTVSEQVSPSTRGPT